MHRHRYPNPHPTEFWMGFGCALVTLSMSSDGLFPLIQAHPTEFWMGYRELWMGFWTALDGRSETMVQSRVLPSSWSTSAARPRDGVMHGRRGRFIHGAARLERTRFPLDTTMQRFGQRRACSRDTSGLTARKNTTQRLAAFCG